MTVTKKMTNIWVLDNDEIDKKFNAVFYVKSVKYLYAHKSFFCLG